VNIFQVRSCVSQLLEIVSELKLRYYIAGSYNSKPWNYGPTTATQRNWQIARLRLKCDGTRADNRFRLSAKRTSPFKSVGASVQSTTGSRAVRISGSNAGYTMFRGSVKSTGYPLDSPVSPSLPVCHHVPSHFNWTLQTFRRYRTCCLHLQLRHAYGAWRRISSRFLRTVGTYLPNYTVLHL
jgi:hypothetical protein